MTGPHPAVAAVRTAVRRLLESLELPDRVAVAVSGGADSLALAAAATHVAPRLGLAVHGLVVDHGLQDGSDQVAADAAKALHAMDFTDVQVLPVTVSGSGGPEAAARKARYDALRTAVPGALVLLGHTRDDQAETVLLGLGRGSGPRSIAGMRPVDPPWLRPLLDVSRETTVAACAALDLRPWQDPHNADPRFTRVRLRREVLPLMEDVLAGGVAAALARTAAQLREDCDALDAVAARFTGEPDLDVLAGQPAAVRRRVLRRWLLEQGVRELTDAQLRAVDGLIAEWRGQGAVWVTGRLEVGRAHGRLTVTQRPR